MCACTSSPDSESDVGASSSDLVKEVTVDTVAYGPSGAWILTEFHDSIIERRAIGHFRLPIPVWTALLLRVDSTAVKFNGTLLSKTEEYSRSGQDTLLVLDGYGIQTFAYRPSEDRIMVMFMNEGDAQQRTMWYRRLRPDELHLITDIDSPHRDSMFRFEENYRAHLTRLLFTGRFEPLDKGQHAFSIDDRGRITGHPNWNEFWFHDYFGTLHPFEGDVDGLVFTDTTKQWPDNMHPFNWKFIGDTLVLRSMTTDGDRYYLSKGELRFLRRS
jgi:hypothetical protein